MVGRKLSPLYPIKKINLPLITKQERKRPLDTPKRMIERREREEREKEREREREVKEIER